MWLRSTNPVLCCAISCWSFFKFSHPPFLMMVTNDSLLIIVSNSSCGYTDLVVINLTWVILRRDRDAHISSSLWSYYSTLSQERMDLSSWCSRDCRSAFAQLGGTILPSQRLPWSCKSHFCYKCTFFLKVVSHKRRCSPLCIIPTPWSVEDFSLINIPTYRLPITPTRRYRSVSFYTKFKKPGTLVLTTFLFLDDILNDIIITHSKIPSSSSSPILYWTPETPKMTDNLPEVTRIIKSMLGDDYNYDSTVSLSDFCPHHSVFFETSKSMVTQCIQNTFRALYRTFTECCFIEDKGDIVFYKNRKGEAARVVADDIDWLYRHRCIRINIYVGTSRPCVKFFICIGIKLATLYILNHHEDQYINPLPKRELVALL